MAKTTAVTVRLDDGAIAVLDDVVTLMQGKAAEFGIKPTRSDAVRFVLTQWHWDHGDALEGMLSQANQDSAE